MSPVLNMIQKREKAGKTLDNEWQSSMSAIIELDKVVLVSCAQLPENAILVSQSYLNHISIIPEIEFFQNRRGLRL